MKTADRSVTFITVCKGRLHHLKQTLPLLLANKPDEIIVVDYACPHNVGDWVRSYDPAVKVVSFGDRQSFNLSKGRNFGAEHASGDILCFIDADIEVAPGFVQWMKENVEENCFYRHERTDGVRDLQTFGTVICEESRFRDVEGYDEFYVGWGGEDNDFYHKLRNSGCKERVFPRHFAAAIPHDDDERFSYFEIKTKNMQLIENRIYRTAKKVGLAFYNLRSELPRDLRQQIFSSIHGPLLAWDGKSSLDIVVKMEKGKTGTLISNRQIEVRFQLGRKRKRKGFRAEISRTATRLRNSLRKRGFPF